MHEYDLSDLAPNHIGPYELLERLGGGGMGEVWAVRSDKGSLLAIKRVLPHLAQHPIFERSAKNEAFVSSMMEHPNCARVFGFEKYGPEIVIPMELMFGASLDQLVFEMRARNSTSRSHIDDVPTGVILRVGIDAANGLHHVHTRIGDDSSRIAIVHRDVSPHNIFVSESGNSKIIDLGIAKVVAELDEATRTGLKGKLGYLSPEQAFGQQVDCRTDVWGLGATLFSALTGKIVFENTSVMNLARVIDAADNPQIDIFRPDLPARLRDAINRSLRKDPSERFQSCAEMAAALLEASKHVEGSTKETVAKYVSKRFGIQTRALRARLQALGAKPEEPSVSPIVSRLKTTPAEQQTQSQIQRDTSRLPENATPTPWRKPAPQNQRFVWDAATALLGAGSAALFAWLLWH